MYNDLLTYFTLRTFFVLFSTAFSILLIMLTLNIISVEEASAILNLSPEAAGAFKTVVLRIQEVTGNILNIISQLLNKLFSWAGVEIDLNMIDVEVNKPQQPPTAVLKK